MENDLLSRLISDGASRLQRFCHPGAVLVTRCKSPHALITTRVDPRCVSERTLRIACVALEVRHAITNVSVVLNSPVQHAVEFD